MDAYTWANTTQTSLIRGSDGACIPLDPGNRDYQEYLASGIVAAEYVAPPAPVRYIAKLDIIDRLEAAGKFDAAMSALASTTAYKQARWNTATQIASDDPDVTAMLTAIGADPTTILA